MPQHHTGVDRNSSIAIVGFCYGNETSVSDCKTYADSNGVLCKSNMAAAVECVQDLPDLVPDPYSLESSSYLQRMSLWLLECALEENCLPDTVYQIIDRNPGNYAWMTRTLLRFSSVIENIGTAAFKPLEEPENWEWHACHMHYHSMKVFSRYEVVDPEQRLVSESHLAVGICIYTTTTVNGLILRMWLLESIRFRCLLIPISWSQNRIISTMHWSANLLTWVTMQYCEAVVTLIQTTLCNSIN
ncbi:Protein-lysine 6-oxidase [Fasciola gigantica]|uniref:Protein-lysine 6-oxidase n=1 Tax=Fasciola gigantica TaxID=46835 RepID=A0A504YP06_FASGI|nr:Protein-lysine 6-oxidase [Fasciola gigantica]